MAAARDLHRVSPARATTGLRCALLRAGRLAHRVGERFEVVTARPGRTRGVGEADDLPAAGRGEALGVLGTEVVTVGFGVGGEGAEDRGRVGVDVRQRRDGGTAASGARTATYRAHDVGRYRTLERAATTLREVTPPCRAVIPATERSDGASLTCGDTRGPGDRWCWIRSLLGANPVIHREIDGLGEIRNRAQPWPEWSSDDIPRAGQKPDGSWTEAGRKPRGNRTNAVRKPGGSCAETPISRTTLRQ